MAKASEQAAKAQASPGAELAILDNIASQFSRSQQPFFARRRTTAYQ